VLHKLSQPLATEISPSTPPKESWQSALKRRFVEGRHRLSLGFIVIQPSEIQQERQKSNFFRRELDAPHPPSLAAELLH